MTILRVSALALNRHVGEPFVVSHSLPHDLLLSFFITCILQVYHPVTLKSEFEVVKMLQQPHRTFPLLSLCFYCACV